MMWLVIGFIGQALFASRFIYQWIRSEQARRSVVPEAFWYLSAMGGLILLVYAVHKQDSVFIAGQAGGLVIYGRNIYLIWRERRRRAEPASDAAA